MNLKSSLLISLCFLALQLEAQDLLQTVRGQILDQDTQSPLIGATVQVIGSDPILGAVTDLDGTFRIENVPVGRATLLVRYLGYEEQVLSNVIVNAGKELVLNVELLESAAVLESVVVTATENKSDVLNEMALVSARSFSVDETKRFAGSLNDPARMTASYAGVQSNPEGSNEIVVRGNSSKGILWRLEGVEIPNPNHFADEGSTGGPINALNINMLSNSDFLTGAFSPEYGNALSAVFDIKYRKGNNEQREYTATASTLGLELSAEGPFSKDYNGSYLVNYRYSSLALIAAAGILDFGGVPKYQDLAFNINLPAGKKHYFSLFGLGGLSNIGGDQEDDDGTVVYRFNFESGVGVGGITHNYLISSNTFLRNVLSTSGTFIDYTDNIPHGSGFRPIEDTNITKRDVRFASTLNHKFNARHKVEGGIIYSRKHFDIAGRRLNFEIDELETGLSDRGSTDILQAFGSWRYRPSDDWTITSGLHYLRFGLNGNFSIEPRVGVRWDFADRHAFTVGSGIHSKLESVSIYLGRRRLDDGTYVRENEDLEITKSAHFVLGYDFNLNRNTHLKLETYYQHLYDVPVENDVNSTYSLLNMVEDYTTMSLVNEGTGRNYGMELTVEQFLTKGFYYLGTVSVFESFYTPLDGIERRTRFSSNYVFNFLAGKEFRMGRPEKNKVLFMNAKVAFVGGAPYTPIDLEASRTLGSQVLVDAAYSERWDNLTTSNFAIGTRRNKGRTTREFKLDIQNVTNAQGRASEFYIEETEEIYVGRQLPFFPTISYSISF